MTYENRISYSTSEAAEKSEQQDIIKLFERINITRNQTKQDKKIVCLQFGTCTNQQQTKHVIT